MMKVSSELYRAISQVDFSYVKEILLNHTLDSGSINWPFSVLEHAATVYKKNPKIYFEILKYPKLYNKKDLSIFSLINQNAITNEDFIQLSNFFDYNQIKDEFGHTLANFAIKMSNWDLIYYCIKNNIQPRISHDFSMNFIYLNFQNCSLDNEKKEEIKEKIKNKNDFTFLENHFSIKNIFELKILPVDEYFFFLKSEEEFINYLFNYNTKSTRKIFYEIVLNKKENKIHYNLISILKILKTCNFSQENLLNFIKEYQLTKNFNSDKLEPHSWNNFELSGIFSFLINNKIISEKKSVNLLLNYFNEEIDHSQLNDTLNMSLRIQAANIKIKNNFKSLSELHDILSRSSRKIMQKNHLFEQQKEIEQNMSHIIPELNHILSAHDLTIYFPKHNYELIDFGQDLSICVGSGYYCDSILSGELFIFFLIDKTNTPKYCISVYNNPNKKLSHRNNREIRESFFEEPKSGLIEQAKGFHNKAMPPEIYQILQEYLYKI